MKRRWAALVSLLAVGCDADEKVDQGLQPSVTASASATEPEGPLRPVGVAAGTEATCARMSDGAVRCWGRNDHGEVGKPKEERDFATPVAIPGVDDAVRLWLGGDTGSSGDMGCAQSTDVGVTCWGSTALMPRQEENGRVGYRETAQAIKLLRGARDLAFGGGSIYAVTAEGKTIGWGSPTFNALGNGDTSSFDRPVTEIAIAGARALAAGRDHGCALLQDQTVTCWGYVKHQQKPKAIEGVKGATAIAAGGDQTCATVEGKLRCWGPDQEPHEVEGLTDVKAVSIRSHACAVDGAGTVHCWGTNDRGELGDGKAPTPREHPRPVAGIEGAIAVAAGDHHSCAVTSAGKVWCWGSNRRGQLGDGTLVDRAAPTEVVGLSDEPLPPADGTRDVPQGRPMDWSGLPEEGCPPPAVAGESPSLEGGFSLASAYARRPARSREVVVDLANYAIDPARFDAPRGPQLALELRLRRFDDDEAEPVDAGKYVFAAEGPRRTTASIRVKSGRATLLPKDGAPATVTITHLGDTWLCGELKLNTKSSRFTGPFAARFVPE